MDDAPGGFSRGIWSQGILYVLWFASAGLGLADLVAAWPVLKAGVALGLRELGPAATKWFSPLLITLSLILLVVGTVLILVCEDRYRREASRGLGRLVRRFAWVTAGEVGFLALALAAGALLPGLV